MKAQRCSINNPKPQFVNVRARIYFKDSFKVKLDDSSAHRDEPVLVSQVAKSQSFQFISELKPAMALLCFRERLQKSI